MPQLAPNAETMPRSGIRRIMDLAWSLDGPVIGLHVGEPSFATPAHVVEAARKALERGETKYVPNAGIDELRDAIAAKVVGRNGLTATSEQVVVSAGGMQAIYVALSATVSSGDEVLIPDPGWPNFEMAVRLLQATPVRYPLLPENGFLPDVDLIDALVTSRTRLLVLNSPSNPLGAVTGPTLAERLVELARRRDLWVLSDECYDAVTFEAEHASPAAFDTDGRVLSCFSFSKTYAMTGLRVGYLIAPPLVAEVARKIQEPLIACVNAPAQHAALAALTGPQDAVEEMRATYRHRRDLVTARLDELGVDHLRPQGAFYMWVDVHDRCDGDVETWALDRLRRQHVATAPGTTFGPIGEGWVRLSLAAATQDLMTGVDRLLLAL